MPIFREGTLAVFSTLSFQSFSLPRFDRKQFIEPAWDLRRGEAGGNCLWLVRYAALWERKMIRRDWGDLIKAKATQRRVKAKAAVLPTRLADELRKVRALAPPPLRLAS